MAGRKKFAGGAEHAQTSRTTHGGHHVVAVAEGEDRILDAE
jgi:hypothetical protein